MDEIILNPIGQVRNGITEKMRHGWREVESEIIIAPELTDSLDGLADFSHIIVLFWMHQSTGPVPVKVHPQGRDDMPLTGVFATRSPHRPNSVGMSVVNLLECDGNVLKVQGLDAINGTPLLDIKPYLLKDVIPGARHPEWVSRLNVT